MFCLFGRTRPSVSAFLPPQIISARERKGEREKGRETQRETHDPELAFVWSE